MASAEAEATPTVTPTSTTTNINAHTSRKYRPEANVHALFAQLDALMTEQQTGLHNPYNMPAPIYRASTPNEEEEMMRGGGIRGGGGGGATTRRMGGKNTTTGAGPTSSNGPSAAGSSVLAKDGGNPMLRNSQSDAKSAFFANMRRQQHERSSPNEKVVGGAGRRDVGDMKHHTSSGATASSLHYHEGLNKPMPQSAPEKYANGNLGVGGVRYGGASTTHGGGSSTFASMTTDDVDAVMVGTPAPSAAGGYRGLGPMPVGGGGLSKMVAGPSSAIGGEGGATPIRFGVRSQPQRHPQANVGLLAPIDKSGSAKGFTVTDTSRLKQVTTTTADPSMNNNSATSPTSPPDVMAISGADSVPASQAGIPSSAHGRLFPRHAPATPGTPLSVLMMNAMRQEQLDRSLKQLQQGGGIARSTTTVSTASLGLEGAEAFEPIPNAGRGSITAHHRRDIGSRDSEYYDDADYNDASARGHSNSHRRAGYGGDGDEEDLGMTPPRGMRREPSMESSVNGTPVKSAAGGVGHGAAGSYVNVPSSSHAGGVGGKFAKTRVGGGGGTSTIPMSFTTFTAVNRYGTANSDYPPTTAASGTSAATGGMGDEGEEACSMLLEGSDRNISTAALMHGRVAANKSNNKEGLAVVGSHEVDALAIRSNPSTTEVRSGVTSASGESGTNNGSRPVTADERDDAGGVGSSGGINRTNSRAALRINEATALDGELQGALKAMEENRRQREVEREARRAQRQKRAARGLAGLEGEEEDEVETMAEESSPQEHQTAPASDAEEGTTACNNKCKRESAPPKSPRTIKNEQFRNAMVRAEGEDREELTAEEVLLWGRLLKDAEVSVEEATIVAESKRRAELKRLAMHLASDDSREREKRRVFEFVRDCLFDEEHARPDIIKAEGLARDEILNEFAAVLRSDVFQCQVDERLERMELFDLLEAEERYVLYEYFVEFGEKIGRKRIEEEWFKGIADPYKRTQDAQGRDELLFEEVMGRVDCEDEEGIDRKVLREMYITALLPIIERDSWKVINAEADARLRIERDEPEGFLAIVINPEDETPFPKSRPMVKWYTQTILKARREWGEHLAALVKKCSDEELSGRLFVQQEQREEWILYQETCRRDAELTMAEVQRREEFEARVAEAEAERRKEAEERLAKQGVEMPPPASSSAGKKGGKVPVAAPRAGAGKAPAPKPATKRAPSASGGKPQPSAAAGSAKVSPVPKRSPSTASNKQ